MKLARPLQGLAADRRRDQGGVGGCGRANPVTTQRSLPMCVTCRQNSFQPSRRGLVRWRSRGTAFRESGRRQGKQAAAETAERSVAGGFARTPAERKCALRRRRVAAARFQARAGSVGRRSEPVRRDPELRRFAHRPRIRLRQRPGRSLCVPGRRQFCQQRYHRQHGICRRGAGRALASGAGPRCLRRGRRDHQVAQGRQAAAGTHALARRSHRAFGKGGIAARRRHRLARRSGRT